MSRYPSWIVSTTSAMVAIALIGWFYLKSRADERAVAVAEDEVYEAVVRDMVAPVHGQGKIRQLVFEDSVLTGLGPEANTETCQESVLKQIRLLNNAPPYNSAADKIYRLVTRGWYDNSPRPDTALDFSKRSCGKGPLSRTFHTDFPRVFINPNSVYFDIVPTDRNDLKDFRQTYPKASGIISLSRVGFDSTLDEAIVSASFVCGGLCGTGQIYILKKRWGRWEVASSSIIWVS